MLRKEWEALRVGDVIYTSIKNPRPVLNVVKNRRDDTKTERVILRSIKKNAYDGNTIVYYSRDCYRFFKEGQ